MKKTGYQKTIKAVAKSLVTGFAAFTVLCSGPNFTPRKAAAIDTVICNEYDPKKIIEKYNTQSKDKKTDMKKINLESLSGLECIAKKGNLKLSSDIIHFLSRIVDGTDENSIISYISIVKSLRHDKKAPLPIQDWISQELLTLAEMRRGSKLASELIKLAMKYKKSFFGTGISDKKIDLRLLELKYLAKFAAAKDSKPAIEDIVKLLDKPKLKSLAAGALYEYMQFSIYTRNAVGLDKALVAKVEKMVPKKDKKFIKLNLFLSLTEEGNWKAAQLALKIIDQDLISKKLPRSEKYYLHRFLTEIAKMVPATKIASRALSTAYNKHLVSALSYRTKDELILKRSEMFLFFGDPEESKKAISVLASYLKDKRLLRLSGYSPLCFSIFSWFKAYSNNIERDKYAAAALIRFHLWTAKPGIQRMLYGDNPKYYVKIDPQLLDSAKTILSPKEMMDLEMNMDLLMNIDRAVGSGKKSNQYKKSDP
jgi:hypothetical protein